ncbi:MAG: hypothetical protein V7L11_16390 [Nostoc sp.]|uniref:hypothetical protein n=1 Tax=Nostoc sp. TaxID=1180 RepID=UPI002FF4934F
MTMPILAICVRMCQINIYWELGIGQNSFVSGSGALSQFPVLSKEVRFLPIFVDNTQS